MARLPRPSAIDGQGTLEYALIIAFVAVLAIVALRILGDRVWSVFECTRQAMEHSITARCGRGGRL